MLTPVDISSTLYILLDWLDLGHHKILKYKSLWWPSLIVLIYSFFHFRYKNIPQMSFDDTGREPEQAFRLNKDPLAELEYPTKWGHEKKSHQHLPIRFPDHHFLSVSVWDDIEFEASRQAVWATEICSLYSHMLWSGSTLSTCFFSFLLLLAVSAHLAAHSTDDQLTADQAYRKKTTKTNWIINTLYRHKVTNLPDFLSVSKALKFTHDL